jgi:hypothetical protein
MDTNEKVYVPTEVTDTPFPQSTPIVTAATQTANGESFTPPETSTNSFPKKLIAHETLSSVFNTVSKKVLKMFTLDQSGGFQIGKYEEGVSGDVRITPNGILGRDQAGNTTFAVDADTGDATFKGTLQAGSVIAGDNSIVMEESTNGNGRIVFYNNGIPVIVIGDPS